MSTDQTITITNQVVTAIRKSLFLPTVQIAEGTRLIEDLGIDSLELAETMMDLEEELGVEFPNNAAEHMRTVGNVVAFLRDGAAA